MSGAVRDGTPGPPSRPTRRERNATRETTITTMKVANCADNPKPRNAAAAPATAPALTKADPKCGIDTSRIAATKATPSQPRAVSSNGHMKMDARLYAEERPAAGPS